MSLKYIIQTDWPYFHKDRYPNEQVLSMEKARMKTTEPKQLWVELSRKVKLKVFPRQSTKIEASLVASLFKQFGLEAARKKLLYRCRLFFFFGLMLTFSSAFFWCFGYCILASGLSFTGLGVSFFSQVWKQYMLPTQGDVSICTSESAHPLPGPQVDLLPPQEKGYSPRILKSFEQSSVTVATDEEICAFFENSAKMPAATTRALL